jgi:bacterioferritin-associated ferredoxin
MDPDDHVCLCYKVSLRKLTTFMNVKQPTVASQLNECFGAGTGCQWCVPFLEKLYEQWKAGEVPDLKMPPAEYAQRREAYRDSGRQRRLDDYPTD